MEHSDGWAESAVARKLNRAESYSRKKMHHQKIRLSCCGKEQIFSVGPRTFEVRCRKCKEVILP